MSQTEAISIPGLREFDPKRHVSKLLHDSENSRVVLFCLEPGQELSPHQSTSEVVFYCVEGKPEIILSNERVPLPGQSIVVCPPNAPHGIIAGKERAVVMAVIAPRP